MKTSGEVEEIEVNKKEEGATLVLGLRDVLENPQ
jgi:hypothetical protein